MLVSPFLYNGSILATEGLPLEEKRVFIKKFDQHDPFLTDCSKNCTRLGTAFYPHNLFFPCLLPKYCSILTAELAAILLLLEHLAFSPQLRYSLIFSDSLSALLAKPLFSKSSGPTHFLSPSLLLFYSSSFM